MSRHYQKWTPEIDQNILAAMMKFMNPSAEQYDAIFEALKPCGYGFTVITMKCAALSFCLSPSVCLVLPSILPAALLSPFLTPSTYLLLFSTGIYLATFLYPISLLHHPLHYIHNLTPTCLFNNS